MRPSTASLVALAFLAACERPDLGDDTADTSDTSDTSDSSDTGNDSDTGDTGGGDSSDTDSADTGGGDSADTGGGDSSDTGGGDTADTDTDSGGDTSTDTGFGWDPLYLYPPGPSCDSTLDNQRGITPKVDGSWAAGRFPADSVMDMTVYQVRVLMRHGTDSQGQACDATGAFEMRLFVTDTAAPPNGSPTALRTKSFTATTLEVGATYRALIYELETPLVVPNTDNLWVAVDGNIPGTGDPSCWQTCKTGNFVDQQNQNFFTSTATGWTWTNLAQYVGGTTDHDYMEYMMTVWYTEQ